MLTDTFTIAALDQLAPGFPQRLPFPHGECWDLRVPKRDPQWAFAVALKVYVGEVAWIKPNDPLSAQCHFRHQRFSGVLQAKEFDTFASDNATSQRQELATKLDRIRRNPGWCSRLRPSAIPGLPGRYAECAV